MYIVKILLNKFSFFDLFFLKFTKVLFLKRLIIIFPFSVSLSNSRKISLLLFSSFFNIGLICEKTSFLNFLLVQSFQSKLTVFG